MGVILGEVVEPISIYKEIQCWRHCTLFVGTMGPREDSDGDFDAAVHLRDGLDLLLLVCYRCGIYENGSKRAH